MDLRVKKTRTAIINAFLNLRSKKPIEKITVTELARLAEINKGTFYLHYRDIYDLSEQLETEVVSEIIKNISHPYYWFENNYEFTKELIEAFYSQAIMINRLFDGQRESSLNEKLEKALLKMFIKNQPELEHNDSFRTILVYTIYGSYYAYKSKSADIGKSIDLICTMNDAATRSVKNSLQ